MAGVKERIKADLVELIMLGNHMVCDLIYEHQSNDKSLTPKDKDEWKIVKGHFRKSYQIWYGKAWRILNFIAPERLPEFEGFYHLESKRVKEPLINKYAIQDYLMGIGPVVDRFTGAKPFEEIGLVINKFQMQLEIIKSCSNLLDSSLVEIRHLLQADLFDSELDSAKELSKKGFLRGAGAVAGVVLEKHLGQVCESHHVSVKKKNPSINDFNDKLKEHDVIEIPVWRNIQRLADLRNLCDHDKKKEPTLTEVDELIEGVNKITKTLF